MEPQAKINRDERRWIWGSYAAALALLIVFWEPIVLGRLAADFYHNYDLGIYSQAIYKISWSDPNPWLSLRHCHIFNDHFDPILCVAAPLAKLVEPALAGIAVELLFVASAPLAVVWLWKRERVAAQWAAVAIVYLLHNRATIAAIDYPFHPTTWAMAPFAWLVAGILADKRGVVLAALVALMSCKEEFPLVGFMAAMLYAGRREFRFASLLAGCAALWLAGVVWLRPWLLGPVVDHAAHRLHETGDFGEQLAIAWSHFRFRFLAQILAPLAPLALWAAWPSRSLVARGALCAAIAQARATPSAWLLLVPLLAIRYVGHAWKFHYLAPLGPATVLGLAPRDNQARPPRSVFAGVCLLLLAVNAPYWWMQVKYDPDDSRPWRADRMASIAKGRAFLLTAPPGPALVEGNLAPRLVTRPELYQVAGPHDRLKGEFRYVFVEKPPRGGPWPATEDDCRRLIAQWRATPGARIVLDDKHVFLAEGSFRDLPP